MSEYQSGSCCEDWRKCVYLVSRKEKTMVWKTTHIYSQRKKSLNWYTVLPLLLLSHFVSDSVQPLRRQPTGLPLLWDSPGKNTGVGCHFLLQCMKVNSESEVAQVMSDPQRPHGLQPTRLLHSWDFPGRSTGVGCHCLLQVHCTSSVQILVSELKLGN